MLVRRVGDDDRDDLLVKVELLARQRLEDTLPRDARATRGVSEIGVGAPVHVLRLMDEVRENALEVDRGHALADPVRVELDGRMSPHLEIVRRHEVLDNAGPERLIDPLEEVLRLRNLFARNARVMNLDEPVEALLQGARRKLPDVVLQGIANKPVVHPDRRRARVVLPLVDGQHMVEQRVEVVKVREQDVDADVPGEPVLVDDRAGEPAGNRVAVEHLPVGVLKLEETVRGTEPGDAGADDDNPLLGLGHKIRRQRFGAPAFLNGIDLVARSCARRRVRAEQKHQQKHARHGN
eukprot:Amastigsp_a676496_131.p2 type:complete len:294 gc:universal Amastigsp_a676496_131:1002-121(-)